MKYKRKKYHGNNNSNTSNTSNTDVKKLTPREFLILSLIAGGFSDKEIANSLFLSWFTVNNYIKNIRSKLDVKSRAHAVVKALRLGLLSFDGIEKTAEVYAAKAVAKTAVNAATNAT